jgi:hypothetical protein
MVFINELYSILTVQWCIQHWTYMSNDHCLIFPNLSPNTLNMLTCQYEQLQLVVIDETFLQVYRY